jgi:hypothetical protein
MNIFAPALDRLKAANLSGQQIAAVAESLLEHIQQNGMAGGSFNLHYIQKGEQPGAEDLVPVITLTLAPWKGN